MLKLRRDPAGQPLFSPDRRGVSVEDQGTGQSYFVPVADLPGELDHAEREEVAKTLPTGTGSPDSAAQDVSTRPTDAPSAQVGQPPYSAQNGASQTPVTQQAQAVPADLTAAQQRAQIMAFHRRSAEDSLGLSAAHQQLVEVSRKRLEAYQDLQARRAEKEEHTRRRKLGTTNGQLFWIGFAGFVVGGMILGFFAQACGAEPAAAHLAVTFGRIVGAAIPVVLRLAKAKTQERGE